MLYTKTQSQSGDWEDHGFSTFYFMLPVAFYLWFLIQLWQMCSWSLFFNPSVIITLFLSFLLKTYGTQSPHIPLLATTLLIYQLSIKCLVSVQWAKECGILSFERHSNMLNLHWNSDVFNRRFVISPRTGVLLACLSPKWQNLTILASEEKRFLFRISFKDYNSGQIIWETKQEVELYCQFGISVIVPKCQPYFN